MKRPGGACADRAPTIFGQGVSLVWLKATWQRESNYAGVAFGQNIISEGCYNCRVINVNEDAMDTELTPTQLAVEFLRRDTSPLTPAEYLKRVKQLELEFAGLMALSSLELKEEIDYAWRLGIH